MVCVETGRQSLMNAGTDFMHHKKYCCHMTLLTLRTNASILHCMLASRLSIHVECCLLLLSVPVVRSVVFISIMLLTGL